MATITSNPVTGDFNDGASWVGGVVPGAGDDIIIANNSVITLDVDVIALSVTRPVDSGGRFLIEEPRTVNIATVNDDTTTIGNDTTPLGLFVIQNTVLADDVEINISAGHCLGQGRKAIVLVTYPVTLTMSGAYTYYESSTGAGAREGNTILDVQASINFDFTGSVDEVIVSTATNYRSRGLWFRSSSSGSVISLSGIFEGSNINKVTLNETVRIEPNNCLVSIDAVFDAGFRYAMICNSVATINGVLTASNTNYAVVVNNAVNFSGTLNDSLSYSAISFQRICPTSSGSLIWNTYDEVNALRPIYTANELTGYPPEAKVEDGTVYGPSSEFEGTLEPWDATFAQALATAQRDLQLPSILSAITPP
jgi:hypothetical protein